jgi:hypothetical protein
VICEIDSAVEIHGPDGVVKQVHGRYGVEIPFLNQGACESLRDHAPYLHALYPVVDVYHIIIFLLMVSALVCALLDDAFCDRDNSAHHEEIRPASYSRSVG